jgi:hypothetical protein
LYQDPRRALLLDAQRLGELGAGVDSEEPPTGWSR